MIDSTINLFFPAEFFKKKNAPARQVRLKALLKSVYQAKGLQAKDYHYHRSYIADNHAVKTFARHVAAIGLHFGNNPFRFYQPIRIADRKAIIGIMQAVLI